MRHPFDGIIPASDSNDPSRRRMLQWMAGATAAPMATHLMGAAADAQETEPGVAEKAAEKVAGKPPSGHRLYFVVPKNFKAFRPLRRRDLGVQGVYLPGLPANEKLKESKGFLAWLTEEQADRVAAAGDVAHVHRIDAKDVSVDGAPPEKGSATLRVHAAPVGWKAKLPKDSYQDINELGQAWARQFSMHGGVKIVANQAVRTPFVIFADGDVPDAVVETIKSHPQVYALEWMTPVGPSTKRLGEEGGETTHRVGEEGGVTTRAIGEEGGATTEALGEEGGRPLPRPRPTTLALGEEGGRGKAPAIPPKEPPQKLTTQALGEEGGGGR